FGRLDEAISVYRKVLSQDPLDTYTLWNLAWALYLADRMEEAVATCRELLDLNPNYASGQAVLGLTLLFMDRHSEALAAAEKEADEEWRLTALPAIYWGAGRRAESDAALSDFIKKYAAGSAYQIASLYAHRGEAEAAFEWLDRAYRQR